MPNLWAMTDEEISKLSEEEIQGGYLWNPERQREARMQETLRQAAKNSREGVQKRPAARITDASTGRVTMDPGGMERRHTAPQGGLAAMVAEAGGGEDVVQAAAEIESMPGGMELLTSYAAEELMKAQGIPEKKAKKIRMYKIGGSVSANPYAKGSKDHASWNDKYASKGFSNRGNRDIPEEVIRKAEGGNVRRAAERTRQAGRGDDSVMLHMTPEEAEVIEAMWGKPDINPNTGIGEYGFLGKVWKKAKKAVKKVFKSKVFQVVAPIALSVFAPGIGTAVGMKLGLSGAAASIAGNAVVQGGLGALSGGKEGALRGAISGGLGAAAGAYGKGIGESLGLSGKTADVVGSALVRGGGGSLMGEDFTSGAIQGGLGAMTRPTMDRFAKDARGAMGLKPAGETRIGRYISDQQQPEMSALTEEISPDSVLAQTAEAATPQMSPVAPQADPLRGTPAPQMSPVAQPDYLGPTPLPEPRMSLPELASKYALPVGAAVLGGLGAAGSADYDDSPPDWWNQEPDQGQGSFGESLPVYTMNRQFQGLPSPDNYFTYGQPGSQQSGQHLFINPPAPFPTQPAPAGGLADVAQSMQRQRPPQRRTERPGTGGTDFLAEGGEAHREDGHWVRGPGTGRSDDIPAVLSDGEYVIDAETVALLGDGSGDEGSRRLDEMRRNLRKHKAKNLKKGEFTHKAKQPAGYMPAMRKLRRAANGGTN